MTDAEFQRLLNLDKNFENTNIILPTSGEKAKPYKILSKTTKDIFYLDIDRKSSITLTKKKLQTRHQSTGTMMVRLEIDCRPHMFPDGTFSSRNHIHIYDEEFGCKVYDLDRGCGKLFVKLDDFMIVFSDFCEMCNIDIENISLQSVV